MDLEYVIIVVKVKHAVTVISALVGWAICQLIKKRLKKT